MEQKGKRSKLVYLIFSLVLIVLGLCMIIWPGKSAEIICTVIGIGLLVFSLLMILRFFHKETKTTVQQLVFAVWVLLAVFGIILLFRPSWILAVVHVLIGIGILIDGIFKVVKAFEAKGFAKDKWWLVLIFAVFTCIFGLILVLNPFKAVNVLMTIIGIILVIEGIQNLWVSLYAMKN